MKLNIQWKKYDMEMYGYRYWYIVISSIVIQDSIPAILDKCKS